MTPHFKIFFTKKNLFTSSDFHVDRFAGIIAMLISFANLILTVKFFHSVSSAGKFVN